MNFLYPRKEYAKVYDIPFEKLYKKGVRGIIFDIDNTLVPHGKPADDSIIKLFELIHKTGIETCLLSNNKKTRVETFASAVDSLYIYKADKPQKKNYYKSMKMMNTNINSTVFVGDQIFTDICGANSLGMYTILVKPVHPKEEIQIVLKRKVEAIVLYFYHRKIREDNL